MRIFFQIVISIILAYWPVFSMTSVMLFAAPGSTDNARLLLIAMGAMLYPALITGVLHIFKFHLWGLPSNWVFLGSLLICLGGIALFGYPRLYLNTVRGISNNGYTVKESKVYFAGKAMKADAKSFQIVGGNFPYYAKDESQVYHESKPIPGVSPAQFRLLTRSESLPEGIAADADATDGTSYFRFGKILKPGSP